MSNLKVVSIKSLADKKESGENVIERLEEMLSMAKDGHIGNVFIAATTTDDALMRCWANSSDCFALAGQIEIGKIEFMASTMEHTL
jgi:hypothetical protein